jgi:hypothetical protein
MATVVDFADQSVKMRDAFLEHMPNSRAHLQRLAAAIVDVEERGHWFSRLKTKVKNNIRPMLECYLRRFKRKMTRLTISRDFARSNRFKQQTLE